ncbi:39S ribosomal protein L40, mitochondrial [Copidosoma floridanum]|uniref:39S ribosomal protein L40, mitochondrial n=1 Tax=Copidosoma floridanum TaxID=29053 RepID=UPI0006C95D0E|nr:39S ribosomal protein L40, mitochondrial [Copidosoma floridanum]
MNIGLLLNSFSRLKINNAIPSRNISIYPSLFLNTTNVLFAEPLKKKRRIDPGIVRAREERRKRKLEKSIRKLQKTARQLKPIAEIEVPAKLKKELELRKREVPAVSAEKLESEVLLKKEWTRYKTKQHKETLQLIEKFMSAQKKSLDELRLISEELYQEAIQIDPELLPFSTKGPVRTPPIEGYDPPDGEYIDITKKYEGET